MAQASRGANAPYVDGETLLGADLEEDFNNLLAAVNDINDSQVNASAAISGSKLAAASIPVAKLIDNTITTAKMALVAWPRAYFTSSTGASALSTSTSYVDADISSLSLANMTANDWVFVDFSGSIGGGPSLGSQIRLRIDLDGTGQAVVLDRLYGINAAPANFQWAFQATSSSHTVKLQIQNVSGQSGMQWNVDTRSLRAQVFPQKA